MFYEQHIQFLRSQVEQALKDFAPTPMETGVITHKIVSKALAEFIRDNPIDELSLRGLCSMRGVSYNEMFVEEPQ